MAGVGKQGGDMDRPEVVKDEGNGREIEREGSLVEEGSSGEAESSGSGLGGDKRLSEVGVYKRGQRKRRRGLVRMKEMGGNLREREVW